jgi:hypothetical protein
MFYSKFIFRSGAERPPQTPTQSPDRKSDQLGQRVQHNLDTKKAAAEKLKNDKAELLKKWKENNKEGAIKAIEDDPKTIALKYISNPKRARETYLLISLMEKIWGKEGLELAKKFFKSGLQAKSGADIDFKWFNEFFSWEKYKDGTYRKFNVPYKLGFYYHLKNHNWWTIDVIKEKKGDKKDEDSGHTYLLDAIGHIRKQFEADKVDNDSGLTDNQETARLKVLSEGFNESAKLIENQESGLGKSAVNWFRKNANGQWKPLTKELIGGFNVAIGEGVGKYLYRYDESQKRVYAILIQGQSPVSKLGIGGFMKIENDKLGKWSKFDDYKKFKTELMDKMEADAVFAELGREKLQAGETIGNKQMLEQTAHMISGIKGISEAHPTFHGLDNYYSDITKKLTAELKTKKGITKNVEVIVKARVDDIKGKIEAIIAKDEDLKEARTKHPTEKLDVKVDYNDKVTVRFNKGTLRGMLRKSREKANEAATSVEGITDSKMKEVREKMKYGILGSLTQIPLLGGFIKGYIEKFFKDGIPKLLRGESAPITTMLLGIAGVSVTPALLGAKKYDSKKFESMLAGLFKNDQMKEAEHKKKLTLSEAHKLKGYTITIPKGKGVILKKGAVLKAEGGPLKGEGPKKKGKMPWAGTTEHEVGKDQEIVIKDGTTIPAGTIITQMTVKKV